MHVKCIHEICHLLLHIPTCILYNVIFMFYNVLWGFSIDTLSLVYNYAEQETPILCIFKYQGPYGTQTDRVFFWSQYFPRDTI
jgi:hypothetical protein